MSHILNSTNICYGAAEAGFVVHKFAKRWYCMNEADHISRAAVHDQLVAAAAMDHFSPCGQTFEQGSS